MSNDSIGHPKIVKKVFFISSTYVTVTNLTPKNEKIHKNCPKFET